MSISIIPMQAYWRIDSLINLSLLNKCSNKIHQDITTQLSYLKQNLIYSPWDCRSINNALCKFSLVESNKKA